jgi:hypothetical protein
VRTDLGYSGQHELALVGHRRCALGLKRLFFGAHLHNGPLRIEKKLDVIQPLDFLRKTIGKSHPTSRFVRQNFSTLLAFHVFAGVGVEGILGSTFYARPG